MLKQRISDNWYYLEGKEPAVKIDLPHDSVIGKGRTRDSAGGAGNGFYPGAISSYIRYFIPEDHDKTILHVDGAYMCCEVTLNENHLSTHPHGYAPYLTDLTPFLSSGVINKLKLDVSAPQPSARWYSGGGCYRDVYLWTGGAVRIEPWQLFVTTELDDRGAMIRAQMKVSSDLSARAELITRLYDPDGQELLSEKTPLTVTKDLETPAEVSFRLSAPRLWNLEEPCLYTIRAEIYCGGRLVDQTVEPFGIRSIEYDASFGFRLNGRSVKMRGGCIHHDHGVLGAACYPDAEERKIRLLKEVGFNAVRISHNPPSLALLETCDRQGMLVMDEAFDMWDIRKRPFDYHLWFRDWWERDLTAMVLRDRNHPCVMSYSIGNEIYERDRGAAVGAVSMMLSEKIRSLDPTRPVTSAVCALWDRFDSCDPEEYRNRILHELFLRDETRNPEPFSWSKVSQEFIRPLDIVGYNYLYKEYESDHELYPERVMWGSETHALDIYDSWALVKKHPYVIGDFTWTAFDNIGEAGTGRWSWDSVEHIDSISLADYPWRTCYQGDLDLCGYRRPQSYYREAVWDLSPVPAIFTTHPVHNGDTLSGTHWHFYDVSPCWTYPEAYLGVPVRTDVYTNGDEVEFILNGRSLGKVSPEKCIASMDIPYEPGEITAVAFRHGAEIGRNVLKTTGKAEKIRLTPERTAFSADKRSLLYVRIEITDQEGRRITDSALKLRGEAEGGKLLGIFSGDPKNEDVYGSDTCHAFEGRALLIVSASEPGPVRIRVLSEELSGSEIIVTALES